MIQNSNGGWTDDSGSSRGLSNQTDLQWLLAHRYVADAILVGSKTALSENYKKLDFSNEIKTWRVSNGLKPNAALVVITTNAENLSKLIAIADYIITTKEFAKDFSEPKLIACGEAQVDLNLALEKMNEIGLVRLNCEGGPSLLNQFLQQGMINQFALTRSSVAGPVNTHSKITESLSEFPIIDTHSVDGFEYSHLGNLPTWEDLLSVGEYFVLRDSGTQAPFSVDYEKKAAPGYYTCRSCGSKLFDASDQFDARCGWPAFWKPNDNANLILEDDLSKGYVRVEVKCGTCESHLGHVFHGEGFGFPTDDRYCINAICLVRKYDEQ